MLVRQTWGSNYIDFLYDESGLAYSFVYNGTQYYYVKNLQGDVVAIANSTGTIVVNYTYDAWGNIRSITGSSASTVGAINPIRYRSYYYDVDTGFYYLQSRYYDPAVRRFINADGYINANGDFIGFNMYAYCGNNPVMGYDPTGDKVWATNPETGETELKEVLQTFENETNELIHLATENGEEIVCTNEHPFYVPVKGWTAACQLRAGDRLQLVNGEYAIVEQVQHEILEAPVKVYNFEVEDFHTYYVGEESVLVHNKCHGNSLKTERKNYGYELLDEDGNILKYGETLNPNRRYSQKWLDDNGYSLKVMVEGSKSYVHQWQHSKIMDYIYVAGHRPPLNNSLW